MGDDLHASIASGQFDAERIGRIIEAVETLNERLTGLEDDFSRTLGEGNRWLERRLLQVTYAATALLLVTGVLVSWMILRQVRQADEALRAQAERWRVTLASIGDGVLVTDAGATVVSLNAVAETLTGWKEHEAIGRDLDEVFRITNEQTQQPAESPARRALRDGRIVGLGNHTVLLAKDGTERPIDDSAAPIKDQEGTIVGVVMVFRDVSERRRAEEQAAARARQHEAIARLSETALGGRDLQSLMNEAAAYVTRTLGTDMCEVLELVSDARGLILRAGVGWKPGRMDRATEGVETNFLAGHTLASAALVVITDLRSETRFAGSTRLHDHGVISGMSAVVAGDAGRHYGVLGTYATRPRSFTDDDVSFLSAVANVLAVAIQRKRAEVALQEANRQKDEFLAMLAHELRNPLSPIRNAVHVLRSLVPNEPRLERAREMIERQVTHMTRLLDDLLDVSRIARGKVSLHQEVVDLAQLVRLAGEDYRATLDAIGLTLTLGLPARPMWVQADPTRLSQAVGNLLHNASKFTNPGGQVTVRLTMEADGRAAILSIRDTGIGMEPDILGRVFETFSQADHSLDRSRGGLGLGLALVKGLVELHGGTVQAFSAGLGAGSEFTIRLPLAPAPERPLAIPACKPAGQRSRRVLVIEDNIEVAESMKYLLEADGHQVVLAHTGRAGIETARQFRPEVVLCDIGLPGGMDGFGVARVMRNDAALSSACLIALTGYDREEDRRRAREAGFDMHLIKPVDPIALDQVLERLSDRANS